MRSNPTVDRNFISYRLCTAEDMYMYFFFWTGRI